MLSLSLSHIQFYNVSSNGYIYIYLLLYSYIIMEMTISMTHPARVILCFLAYEFLYWTKSKGAVVPWPTVVSLHSSDILGDTQASHCAHPLSHRELIGTNQWMAVLTCWGIRPEPDLTGFAPCGLDEGQILSKRYFTIMLSVPRRQLLKSCSVSHLLHELAAVLPRSAGYLSKYSRPLISLCVDMNIPTQFKAELAYEVMFLSLAVAGFAENKAN